MPPEVIVLSQYSLLHFACLDCRGARLRKRLMDAQIMPGGTVGREMKLVMLNVAVPRSGWVGEQPLRSFAHSAETY